MTDRHLGVFFQVLDGPSSRVGVVEVLLSYYAARGVAPDRITSSSYGVKTRAFKPGRLREIVEGPGTHYVTLWRERGSGTVDANVYLHPFDPAEQRFQNRHVSLTWTADDVVVGNALRDFLVGIVALYPVAHGSVGSYRSKAYASREAFRSTTNVTELDPATAARLQEDAMCRAMADGRLRRLYPVTIIGPQIWAQLPPMPAFDPMPKVEALGDCKLVTAWPTLCEPRDPAFLRGTRALREWLWPYTIQNPADHVDNDPPMEGV